MEGCGIVEMNLGLGWWYSLWVGVGFGFGFGCLPTHLAPNIAVCRPLGALLLVALDLLKGDAPIVVVTAYGTLDVKGLCWRDLTLVESPPLSTWEELRRITPN